MKEHFGRYDCARVCGSTMARRCLHATQRPASGALPARDAFGKSLMAVTGELSAPDDRTLRFRLTKPFPHLLAAMAGSSTTMPCIMPERLATTDPFRQVTEMVGSGPYRFLPAEFNAGERATYERFTGYLPRGEGTPSYTAGPKVTHFDRIEWHSLGDAATSVSGIVAG